MGILVVPNARLKRLLTVGYLETEADTQADKIWVWVAPEYILAVIPLDGNKQKRRAGSDDVSLQHAEFEELLSHQIGVN